jgi:hypothetical protein
MSEYVNSSENTDSSDNETNVEYNKKKDEDEYEEEYLTLAIRKRQKETECIINICQLIIKELSCIKNSASKSQNLNEEDNYGEDDKDNDDKQFIELLNKKAFTYNNGKKSVVDYKATTEMTDENKAMNESSDDDSK